MKYFIILWIFLLGSSMVSAQDHKGEWLLGLGFQAVDDDGKPSGDLFVNLNGLPFPTNFAVETYLHNSFSLEVSESINSYQIGKKIDGSATNRNRFFMSLDVNGKYHLNTLYKKFLKFDPYVAVGLGATIRGAYTVPTGIVGGGATFWITNQIGINYQSLAKFSFTDLGTNYLQHTLGVRMNFGK